MSSAAAARGFNIPYTFDPSSNGSVAPTISSAASKVSTTQDRLIVGVDFGTTYSGMLL
jgi:hypothetical protein